MVELLKESRLATDLTINEFILSALDKSAHSTQPSIVGGINAARLLVANRQSSFLSLESIDRLEEEASNHDGEPIPDRIVAPTLRVRDDFSNEETVWAQTGFEATWQELPLFAIDHALDCLAVTEKVHVQPLSRIDALIDPRAITVFSKRDYEILEKPTNARRQYLNGLAARFALGLSTFAADSKPTEIQTLKSVHHRFRLVFNLDTFRRRRHATLFH